QMKTYRYVLTAFLLPLLTGMGLSQNAYEIDVQIRNATSDTIYLAYFYGDAQYIRDTAVSTEGNLYTFRGEEALPEGVYMFVMPPENSFFQVLIDEDQNFTMKTDAENISASTVI